MLKSKNKIDKNQIQKFSRVVGKPGNRYEKPHKQRLAGWRRTGAVALIGLASFGAYNDIKDNYSEKDIDRIGYTVESGDTLWGIAKRINPDGNTGEIVFDLRKHIITFDGREFDGVIFPQDIVNVPRDSSLGEDVVHKIALEQNANETHS